MPAAPQFSKANIVTSIIQQDAAARPVIHLAESEADALYALALTVQNSNPERSRMLLEELDRAEVYSAGDLPKDAVTMGSKVSFEDANSGNARDVQLVYPQDADIASGRVSILSPVGIGLIGMRAGSAILWPDRDGKDRLLKILHVEQP